MIKKAISIFWFRRDLRLEDNVGFTAALKEGIPVLPIFIFDKEILDKLPENDVRVPFIYDTLQKMREQLERDFSSSLALYYSTPQEVFSKLARTYDIQTVHTNRDYEPYARERDVAIAQLLGDKNIEFKTYKDQVIFEENEIVKKDGLPYVVYTPFKNKWKEMFRADTMLIQHNALSYAHNLLKGVTELPNLTLQEMGFVRSNITVPDYTVTPSLIELSLIHI